MQTINIDGLEYQVDDSHNLLQAVLSLGLDLEYFCWHPALGSVGACRQCAVKQFRDEDDTQGQIVMACMTPVQDGLRISIDHPEAKNFRAQIIEWLMVNHPHDCPICDEGGECHLQDMTEMSGHNYRRYRFNKRTYKNQYLGPLINHEMNRCIQCYRCVRFYQDYAGSKDLDVFGAHDHVYFGRHEDGVLESVFSGNLVEVCPTGVFTDKTLKEHYTRKWDLQTAPSICTGCGLGCNTLPGERYGKLRRIRNRYNHSVNGYFLCDRGRYGYEFVNSEKRIRKPLVRNLAGHSLEPATRDAALKRFEEIISKSNGLIGIGSPRASLEANFALRSLVGADRFFAGCPDRDHELVQQILTILRDGPARTPSINDVAQGDAGFVLGEDLTNSAPLLALAVRQMVRRQPLAQAVGMGIHPWNDSALRDLMQDQRGPLFIATPYASELDEIASQTLRATPQDLARLGYAVAHIIDPAAPEPSELSPVEGELAREIARSLMDAERPVILSGTSCGSLQVLKAAANVAWALHRKGRPAELCFTVPECNSLGLGLMTHQGLERARHALSSGGADTLIVLENDLYRRGEPSDIGEMLESVENLVVLDCLESATSNKGDLVFPAATFAESDGTLVSSEGRAQGFYQVFVPEQEGDEIRESWRWIRDMLSNAGEKNFVLWENWDQILAAMVGELPVFSQVLETHPKADLRVDGAKLPRQPHRYSGRTAMRSQIDVHEPKPPDDPDTPLAFSMEGFKGQQPEKLIARFWAPGWNSVQALNKFQDEVGGPLRGGDPGLRLIEPNRQKPAAYFDDLPEPFQARQGEFLVTPRFHIFGSEPLSLLTPGVHELAPRPYIAVNKANLQGLDIDPGDQVILHIQSVQLKLPVTIDPSLPSGVAVLPAGLAGMAYFDLPDWGEIAKSEEEGP